MSLILADSIAGYSIIVESRETISASTTLTIDTVDITNYHAAKWLVSIHDTVTDQIMSYEVYASYKGVGFVDYARYAIVGDTISHVLNVYDGGGTIDLEIQNILANDIVVTAVRLPVLI